MTDPREPYGRLVHRTRLEHEAERAAAEGRIRFILESWENRTGDQRELDMRIGAAAAAAERARIRELAVRVGAVCSGDEGTGCYFADLLREPDRG